MPGQKKYSHYADTVPVDSPFGVVAGGRGASDQKLIKTVFPVQPGMEYAAVAATANAELCPDILPKNPDPTIYTNDNIKLGFGSAPNIEDDVKMGVIGGPSSPWFPNLTSPDPSGAGGVSPIQAVPFDPAVINKNASPDVDGLVNPADSSAQQSNATKVGTVLTPGKHPGSL
jgi:hypothetical protein